MDRFEARWNNALKIAHKINEYIQSGHVVCEDMNNMIYNVEISKNSIDLIFKDITVVFFEKDKTFDHGMHTTIKEFNSQFGNWMIYKKVPFKGFK